MMNDNSYANDIDMFWGSKWENSEFGIDILDSVSRYKFKYYLKPILDVLPKNAKICEIGSGSCQWLLLAKAYRPDIQIYGVELSPKSIAIGKKLGVKMILSDVRNIYKVKDNFFDFVYSWGVIEHMFESKKAFSEHYRISNKFIVVDVPNSFSIPALEIKMNIRANKLTSYEAMIRYGNFFSIKSLSKLVNSVSKSQDMKTYRCNYLVLPTILGKFFEKFIPDFIRKLIGHNLGVIIIKRKKARR
jgi:ubiquinone/menaquinone biosynthesis C-methylase UbiE